MATSGGPVLLEKQGRSRRRRIPTGALIRKDGETPLFDGLGSERTVTNGSGAVQGTLTSLAFGQTLASTGSSTSAYQWGATSGYRAEGDAGLTLVGCRFYDAQVGRFITRDTYLDQKPYAYCDGDPVNRIDPDGHSFLGWGTGVVVTYGVAILITVTIDILTDGAAAPLNGVILNGVVGVISGAAGGLAGGTIDGDPVGGLEYSAAGGAIGGVITGGLANGPWGKLAVKWLVDVCKPE